MKDVIIVKSIDYIMTHLDEELTVEAIAEHCHFSKFYFNRMFKSIVGESIYAFIKRLRIEKSAGELTRKRGASITEICSSYGYSSSNYSTAFRNHYGESPASFKKKRKEGHILKNDKGFYADLSDKTFEYYNDAIEIVELEDMEVIFKRYIGDYHHMINYWEDFCHLYGNYIDDDSWRMKISYDDPILTDPDRCITDICITTSKSVVDTCPTMIVLGGKFVKYHFEGPNHEIFEVFQGLFEIWLQGTNHVLDFHNRKMLTRYKTVDIENNHFSFDIYIPVI